MIALYFNFSSPQQLGRLPHTAEHCRQLLDRRFNNGGCWLRVYVHLPIVNVDGNGAIAQNRIGYLKR